MYWPRAMPGRVSVFVEQVVQDLVEGGLGIFQRLQRRIERLQRKLDGLPLPCGG